MAKITIDIPDDLLTELTTETNNPEVLERRLPEILRLGLGKAIPTRRCHDCWNDSRWQNNCQFTATE